MQGSGKRSLVYVAGAILVAGVLVSATLTLAPMSRPPTTVTATSIATTTVTSTSPMTGACPVSRIYPWPNAPYNTSYPLANITCGVFTYGPIVPLQVLSVEATGYTGGNVVFYVTVENVGNSTISFQSYVLNSNVYPNPSLSRGSCNCPGTVAAQIDLNHDQNFSLFSPASGDQFVYRLTQPGNVAVSLNFSWTEVAATPCVQAPCSNQPPPINTTVILAQFAFP